MYIVAHKKTKGAGFIPGTLPRDENAAIISAVKKAIWLYYLLLIFEGALRKWILPPLATPLLLVRDPVACYLIFMVWHHKLVRLSPSVAVVSFIGIAAIYSAVFMGHGNLWVALFGARIMLLHFPVIFIIAQILTRKDIIQMGIVTMWISIPMALLIASQFYSPQSAWINRGLGGDINGAGFDGAMGYFRPPGTFSFTNGITLFYGFDACFLFYFLLNQKEVNKLLLAGATLALLAAIPLSISRGLFFQVLTCTAFTLMAISRKPQYIGRILLAALIGTLALLLLNKASFFQTATAAFTDRFTTASEHEGGLHGTLNDRFLGGLILQLSEAFNNPFFGYGIGMGTNAGSQLLVGNRSFLIAESEWGRLFGELGAVMGIIIIMVRLSICLKMLFGAYRKLATGDLLPWIMLSFSLIAIGQGGWAQPTSMGFSIICGGVALALVKREKEKKADIERPVRKINPQH
ncbi:hypothetical protein QTN47_20735 [Danxiaibacter flavus]|uniref:O-antigen ligase domain-containing protein n=1 Tax=Danxiaibacter flavus TaxID=3049108 RepID=A0ABV3ZJB9_9BACT|nr:hypothetical protein QNM32_20740 [Chitinophagaceae bacterium DXS]